MSVHAPAPILISRTAPSNVLSVVNDFWNVRLALGTDTANDGVSSAAAFTVLGSLANAEFGAEFGVVVLVTHVIPVPTVWFCTQPAGNAGGVTPASKFWVRLTTGVP